jgi:hypothetical protein
MHVLEKLQLDAKEKEQSIKKTYGKVLAKQLISGAETETDYSYQAERNMEWWVKYNRELEKRL